MRFGILGAVEVWDDDGEPISVGGPRVRALLAFLLLNAGKVVPPELLIDGLYGEEPPAGAANALQSQVSRLRRGLRGLAEVELLPAGYRLTAGRDEIDSQRFAALAESAGRESGERRAELLGEALELWRGAALADVPEARGQALRLEEARIAAQELRAETLMDLGRHAEVVAELRELVEAHPLRERLRALLMRSLYGSGRQAEALEAYERARRMLADELGADPSKELADVHLRILRAEPEPGPPVAPVGKGPGPRLPAQLTSFVGRDEELDRIEGLLGASRLVTLLGPGGAGKTRLSIEIGARLGGEVAFVDFAPLAAGSGQDLLAQAANTALGLREVGVLPAGQRAEPVERLTAALADRDLVLILDNCEHVVAEAAVFAGGLLTACDRLRVIATSREPLAVTGETLWPVRQLAVPPERAPFEEAAGAPAVRLFTDRAAAVRPGFAVTEDNLGAVVRICSSLDGQPLAIELAAARLRTLTAQEVADRLGDRFRLLSRGDRSKNPRHQTLRAVVEWSWGLLAEEEQVLSRRLTVFTGGFTAAAAETVCGADEDVLLDLADKSLIVRGADGRFRMLDTIAAFCAEKREETGEGKRLRDAHAAHFLAFVTEANDHMRTAEQIVWLDRLTAEHGNLSAALNWAAATDLELALRYVDMLSAYWWLRGNRSEGAAVANTLLAKLGGVPLPGFEEEYVACVANLALGSIPAPALPDMIRRSDTVLNTLGRALHQPFLLAMWALAAGPPDDYGDRMEEILEARHDQFAHEPWGLALMKLGIGFMNLFSSNDDDAESHLWQALAEFGALGERWGMTQTQDALATLFENTGDLERALALREEALVLIRELGTGADTAEMLMRRADILLLQDRTADARDGFRQAEEVARRSGSMGVLADVHRGLGDIALGEGDLAAAQDRYEQALEDCPPRWYSAELVARCHLGLARVARGRGDAEAARRHVGTAEAAVADYFFNKPIHDAAEEILAGLD
ncbi:BTAD domain-containing putative transcriptional regulator [Actinocorallia longicatena]